MTAVHDVAFDIETWRDATIQQILDGDIERDGGYARIAHALHDLRIRDVIVWHAVNGNAEFIKNIAVLAASAVPTAERADAYAVAAICCARMGVESLASGYADLAFDADNDNRLAILLIITKRYMNKSLIDAVEEVFAGLRVEECRNGVK